MLDEWTWFSFSFRVNTAKYTPVCTFNCILPLFFFSGPRPQTEEDRWGIQRLPVELGQRECTHGGQPYSTACTKTYRATTTTTTTTTAAAATADHRASAVCITPSSNWNLLHLLLLFLSISLWLQPQHHWTPQTCLRPRVSEAIRLPAAQCSDIWVVML